MKLDVDTKVSDEIPTASMADIAFLLIIYFMITTTFAATQGLDFQLPQEQEVIIRPDPAAPYGHMVDVFDELRQAEDKIGLVIRNISIPTQREIEAFWY